MTNLSTERGKSTGSSDGADNRPLLLLGGPVRAQYALRALAALGPSLSAEHADQLIELLDPIVPREQNRFTDDEMVSALAALARRTDLLTRVVAGRMLVDAATRYHVQQATTALQRLPLQEEFVDPLAAAVENGNADAADVLATWDVWIAPMATHLRAAAGRLLREPVGQPPRQLRRGMGRGARGAAPLRRTRADQTPATTPSSPNSPTRSSTTCSLGLPTATTWP